MKGHKNVKNFFKPFVHHITNFVVMKLTANVTLHVGGSPVMVHSLEDCRIWLSLRHASISTWGH